MANYQNLLNSIAAVIKTNGNQEITGAVLQSTLQSMVSVMGANATYGGVAHPTDSPGTPDGPVVYVASEMGIYTNFGAISIDADELAMLLWNPTTGTWSKESLAYIADKREMEDLIQQGIEDINDAKTDAIDDIEQIVQSVDVAYDTISGENVQLKNGGGSLLMPKTNTSMVDAKITIDGNEDVTVSYITAVNKWNYNPSGTYYGAIIAVAPNTKLRVELTDAVANTSYALLKNLNGRTTTGSNPSFSAFAPSRINVNGPAFDITIPSDTYYLYLLYGTPVNGVYPYKPRAIYIYDGVPTQKTTISTDNEYSTLTELRWMTGNPINSASVGEVRFGTSEANANKIIHTPLYNVVPGSRLTISGTNTDIELYLIMLDNNYNSLNVINGSLLRSAGSAWSDIEIELPENVAMISLEGFCADGSGWCTYLDIDVTMQVISDNPTSFFPRPLDDGYQHLVMKIALCQMTSGYTPSNSLELETQYYLDHGILYLPENYAPKGEPVRLIMFTHGHAVNYTSSSTRFNSNDIKPEYWASEGYAIFDMDASVTGTFSGNHDYEPAAINAYETAYQWIVAHYNVRRDGVFSIGRSEGGGMQFVLCKSSTIPIIASVPIVPVTSPLGYLLLPATGTQRKELLAAYGVPQSELDAITWTTTSKAYHEITNAERTLIVDNQWRFAPYQPGWQLTRPFTDNECVLWSRAFVNKDSSDVDDFFDSVKDSLNVSVYNNIPIRMYTCTGDPTVYYKQVECQHRLMTYAGANAQIHIFPACADHSVVTTDHRFEINPENLVTYTNSRGQTLQNVPKVYIEALAFWRKYENQDNID